MIRQESILKVADNSGAKVVQCIRVLGSKKSAGVGDRIVVAVKKASTKGNIKKKSVEYAVILRTKKEKRRKDGSYIRFSDNAVSIISKDNEPKATRIFGAIAREVRDKYSSVASIAREIY